MKQNSWPFRLAASLGGCAVLLYAVRWFAFDQPALHNEMWRFLIGDIAFLFVQVPLVTLVIDRVIERRQHDEMLVKLNMIIGAFFSETGTALLGRIAAVDTRLCDVRDDLTPTLDWKNADYERSMAVLANHKPEIDLEAADLPSLHDALHAERGFMLSLLANQNLLEHEGFTDLLWALTHLGEELHVRSDLTHLAAADALHVKGDIQRVYDLLGREWLEYLHHLQTQYPFLFSLAVRTNPLDPHARAEVA